MTISREDISFRTIDGLTLRGWLYPAAYGPAIIITPGVSPKRPPKPTQQPSPEAELHQLLCVKEMFVPQVAEVFQEVGINALVYDPRSLGESDGQPRNEIDPSKQVSDYSDALSFLVAQKTVDPERIAVWGMSFSAPVALCAASLDKRARLCIAACPYLDVKPPPEKVPQVLAKCMKDRESRHVGNPPTYLPMLTATGRNPAGLHLRPTPSELSLILAAQTLGAANFENRCTLETYYNFMTWSPEDVMKYLPPTPVLFIVPKLDTWSPPEKQLALFGTLASPKRVRCVPGKGHLTLFEGEEFAGLMELQVEFLKLGFEGKLV